MSSLWIVWFFRRQQRSESTRKTKHPKRRHVAALHNPNEPPTCDRVINGDATQANRLSDVVLLGRNFLSACSHFGPLGGGSRDASPRQKKNPACIVARGVRFCCSSLLMLRCVTSSRTQHRSHRRRRRPVRLRGLRLPVQRRGPRSCAAATRDWLAPAPESPP